MQPARSSARNAEREFLDSITQFAAAPIDRARQVQQCLDDAISLRLPVPEAREIPFADLSRTERNSFFGAFDDTVPGELA